MSRRRRSSCKPPAGSATIRPCPPSVRPWLIPNPAIVSAAIEALAAWPTAAPLPDLLKVAQTSTVRTHKILALRGFIDLIGLSADSDAQKLQAYQQAMTLADQPAEKKGILAKLTQLQTPEALDWAVSFLSNSELKQEAAQAVIAIARSVGLRGKEKTAAALKAVLNADVVTDLKQQAQQVLDSAAAVRATTSSTGRSPLPTPKMA